MVIAKVDADAHKELATKYDVKGFPTLKWFPKGSLTPEDYEGGRSAEEIVEFINKQTGLSKKIVSAPSAVAALTPETFDAVVGQASTFKLLEFYAPWCGHCKQLAPVYEKLGAVFEGEPSVVIAKIDADKHRELGERFGVSGFPTLKFIPGGAMEGGIKAEAAAEPYEGPRDLEGLVAFINEKAGTARASDGSLLPTAGRTAELDAAAAAFMAASPAARAGLAAALPASASAPADRYAKVMAKVLEKGAAYAAKELARLEAMLGNEAIAKSKKTDIAYRRNVLAAFAAPAEAEAEKKEL